MCFVARGLAGIPGFLNHMLFLMYQDFLHCKSLLQRRALKKLYCYFYQPAMWLTLYIADRISLSPNPGRLLQVQRAANLTLRTNCKCYNDNAMQGSIQHADRFGKFQKRIHAYLGFKTMKPCCYMGRFHLRQQAVLADSRLKIARPFRPHIVW
jgi:hypothetical protein